MTHSDRKIHKKHRGSRTCGYGGAQKHRGSGSRGGVGKAGGKKQKWSFVSKNFPGYFGRKGFKIPRKNKTIVKSINLRAIEDEFAMLLKEGIVVEKDNLYHINLKELGYTKLLGFGNATKPYVVFVDTYSKKALDKIQSAGGKIESGVSETGN